MKRKRAGPISQWQNSQQTSSKSHCKHREHFTVCYCFFRGIRTHILFTASSLLFKLFMIIELLIMRRRGSKSYKVPIMVPVNKNKPRQRWKNTSSMGSGDLINPPHPIASQKQMQRNMIFCIWIACTIRLASTQAKLMREM